MKALVPASVLALLACTALAQVPIFNDATIDAHRARQSELTDSAEDILNRASNEARELTAEERREVDSLMNEAEQLEEEIGLRERVLNRSTVLNQPRGRVTEPDAVSPEDDAPTPRQRVERPQQRMEPRPRVTALGNGGFRSFGDFAMTVKDHVIGRRNDNRLQNAAASTYGSEGTGADGGFAVPPDFANAIAGKVFDEESLVARCDDMPSSTNSKTMPIDMTTPWDSSGGIQVYWDGEGRTMTQSKPKLEEVTFKASKVHCLVPLTEELLEDAPAMGAYLYKKAPEKLDFSISDKIVRGTGAGMPLGYMNSPCLVTQAAEGGQAADTIVQANISKMFARMPITSRRNAVWLIHPDAEPQLDALAVGNMPIYMPPGGISEAPYGRLKGRPVIPHQVCETVGDLGDLMFVDLSQYLILKKVGGGRDNNGFKAETSIHLWFDQDLTAFKFTIRLGGQPWWSAATPMRDGSNTMSPFITLAAR